MLFRDFVRDGGSILLSTLTLSVADEICDRFGVLKDGRLVAEGTHADLAAKAGGDAGLEDIYLKLTGV